MHSTMHILGRNALGFLLGFFSVEWQLRFIYRWKWSAENAQEYVSALTRNARAVLLNPAWALFRKSVKKFLVGCLFHEVLCLLYLWRFFCQVAKSIEFDYFLYLTSSRCNYRVELYNVTKCKVLCSLESKKMKKNAHT